MSETQMNELAPKYLSEVSIATISEFVHQASIYRDFSKLLRNGDCDGLSLISFTSPEVQRLLSLPPSPNHEYKDCDVIFALAALVTPKSFRVGLRTFVEDIRVPQQKDYHFEQYKSYVQSFNKRLNLLHICIRNVNADDVSTLVVDAFMAGIQPEQFRIVVQTKASTARWGLKETQSASLKEWEGLQKSIDTAVLYGIVSSKKGTHDDSQVYHQQTNREPQRHTAAPFQRPPNGWNDQFHAYRPESLDAHEKWPHDQFSPPGRKRNSFHEPRPANRSGSPPLARKDQLRSADRGQTPRHNDANGRGRQADRRSPPPQHKYENATGHRIPLKRRRPEGNEEGEIKSPYT